MALSAFILFFSLFLITCSPSSSSTKTTITTLRKGSSLYVEKPDDKPMILSSPDGVFSAGFYSVGENAFCFSIWFSMSNTVVWMANRDQPINGRGGSRLSLLKNGNLVLLDAGRIPVWSTNTVSASSSSTLVQLNLLNTGNLVLRTMLESDTDGVLWQSFHWATDTLLPQQLLTKDVSLVSMKSKTDFSSGFYKLYFDNDNVIRLAFKGREISSIYWPDPGLVSWEAGRTTYNNSQIAMLSSSGQFTSSDDLFFEAADSGDLRIHRRLTLDFDGNVRLYSLERTSGYWWVSWQALSNPCEAHGICGPNSLCSYSRNFGRRCSCIPGFEFQNPTDWSYGCKPKYNNSGCNHYDEASFLQLPHVEFYGYDYAYYPNYTHEKCKNVCLQLSCKCKAFLLKFKFDQGVGVYNCYPKTLLLNGYQSPSFNGTLYLKVPKTNNLSYYYSDSATHTESNLRLNCSTGAHVQLDRKYDKKHENRSEKFLLWFACAVGGMEMICIFSVWCILFKNHKASITDMQGNLLATTGFRRFSYAELKKATKGFREEIGRGGGGIVYKGILSDDRVAAIKRLPQANQGEAEFLAEVTTIGRLNHMHLIEMWGYCAEGKHRLLVYEYMECGSLAENLSSNALDCEKRHKIAVGTAKGLAYLHEECLEWILHCDIKPQNILLDSNYHPKVADFGLSKLIDRDGLKNSSFSRIRGTRGYMAPEWIFYLPITSKVDVYSYGIVMLEMVTGKNPAGVGGQEEIDEGMPLIDHRRLVTWVRERINHGAGGGATVSWVEEIIDPKMIDGKFDINKMRILIEVALKCVEEDKDSRPSMSEVVKMLQIHEDY